MNQLATTFKVISTQELEAMRIATTTPIKCVDSQVGTTTDVIPFCFYDYDATTTPATTTPPVIPGTVSGGALALIAIAILVIGIIIFAIVKSRK